MTREIKTPADAVPQMAYPKRTAWNGGPVNTTGPEQPMFTAAECAQIAEAYLLCALRCHQERHTAYYHPTKDMEEFAAWRDKFKEWQST